MDLYERFKSNQFYKDIEPKIYEGESTIKCTYDIKDYDETQIISNEYLYKINYEIEQKIKIWNNNKRERINYKKKFDKLGLNTIYFIIEKKLNDMSFMFSNCLSLKQVQFIFPKSEEVTDMESMFTNCEELEYIDLSNFNTINVNNMEYMFNRCKKLKEIKGINNFNTKKSY